MKKLLYGLIFISSAALMSMDTEEFDSADASESWSFMNDNENFASAESFEFSLDSENNDSIEESQLKTISNTKLNWLRIKNSPYLYVNPARLKKDSDAQAELTEAINLTQALEDKVGAYLDEKAAIETLCPINSLVHTTAILDKLLLYDNPHKTEAIKTVVLHAPNQSYFCPSDKLQQRLEREGHCQTFIMGNPSIDSLLMLLTKLTMPSTLSGDIKPIDKGMQLGMTGYLIAKLPLTTYMQDEIFRQTISLTLNELILRNKNKKKLFQNGLGELTINDLVGLNSNVMRHSLLVDATLPYYHEAVTKAKTEWIHALKLARATFKDGGYDYQPSKKQAAFDAIIRPMVAEILPTHQLDYIHNFDSDIEYVNGFDSDDE